MSTNLSKIKRDKMLDTISKIKENINDDETLKNLSLIEYELTKKKYGLVWEEHEEKVDEELKTKIPTFEEVKDKEILSNKDDKFNFLLEGDNLHSLYLLEKTHKGKIDVIYIDPPYNTGASNWKYDNNYVDDNDGYKHSKWLSMMERRLNIAKRLLKPTGALVCAIDENEQPSLGLLLDELFGLTHNIDCITVIHNPGGIQGANFSYNNEFAYFVYPKVSNYISKEKRDGDDLTPFRDWGKENSKRFGSPNCFYPIIIKNNKVVGFGDIPDKEYHPTSVNEMQEDGTILVYPIDKHGIERRWRFARDTVETIKEELVVTGNEFGKYNIQRNKKYYIRKTVWDNERFNANIYGTQLLSKIIDTKFPFPKSLYLVEECIKACEQNNNSIILDFFAGSGTTGHAVLELNKQDNGNRQFILCTNNENNICEEVTYQRIKSINNGNKDIEPIPTNLKYYKTSFIPRLNTDEENIQENLLVNIKNLIQLENGISVDNEKIRVILDEEEIDKFSLNTEEVKKCERLYISTDILLTSQQVKLFKDNNVEVYVIPEYYFENEIREVQ